ncbi:hypothetical protein B0H14DRAFT_866234 [Mycena olivaceomarginata]|nr:hypothetical protein B0H14DRAFT_866234 [Mycena olivaceomarginata]
MPQGRGRPILRPNMSRRGTQSDDGFCSSPERANTSSSCSSRPTSPLSSWMAEGAPGDFRRGNRLRQNTRSSSDSDEEDTGIDTSGYSTAGSAKTATYSPHDEKPEISRRLLKRHGDHVASDSGDSGFGELEGNAVGKDTKTGTFFIYSPPDDRPESPPVDSFTTHDLAFIQANLGIGGCLMSIHEPVEAESWIEKNWNDPVLNSLRNSGCGGPFPWMLSPSKPALAIFGSYNEPVVVNMAQTLAHSSRLPVVIRPAGDNPALTLLAHDTAYNGYLGFNNEEREERRHAHDEDGIMAEDEATPEEPGNGGRRNDDSNGAQDGGGDGGGDSDDGLAMADDKWESPLHSTRVRLRLKPHRDATGAYEVSIGYTLKFKIIRDTEKPIDLENLNLPLSRPEVIALLDYEIENRPRETQVDRSYATIGFVAHREDSIARRIL